MRPSPVRSIDARRLCPLRVQGHKRPIGLLVAMAASPTYRHKRREFR
jgi:hypothetical protein